MKLIMERNSVDISLTTVNYFTWTRRQLALTWVSRRTVRSEIILGWEESMFIGIL